MKRREFLAAIASVSVVSSNKSTVIAESMQQNLATTEPKTIPTIRDIKKYSANQNEIVWLEGYYTAFDGGQGFFIWEENSTAINNMGTIIAPAPRRSGRWKRLNDETKMNPKWFGAKGDGQHDDSKALIRMRDTMRAKPMLHYKVFFPRGHYIYQNNRWLFGLNKITINATRVQFENISRSRWHADKRPINTHSIWDDVGDVSEAAPKKQTTGTRIENASIGDFSITLTTMNEFSEGDRILLHGFNQQNGGFPPNLRFFQWNKVIKVFGRKITLTEPVKYNFKSNGWKDYGKNRGLKIGKARVIKLNRTKFNYPEHIEILGGEFLPARYGGPDNFIIAAENLVIKNIKTSGIATPSENKKAVYRNCEFGSAEPDKICDEVKFSQCTFNGSVIEGSGINLLKIKDCKINKGIIRVAPRRGIIKRNVIVSPEKQIYGVIQNKEAWPTELLIIEDNHIIHDGSLDHVVNNGIDGSLTIDGVGRKNRIELKPVKSIDSIKRIMPGTLLYASDLSDWGRVTDIGYDGTRWVLQGDWKRTPSGIWKFSTVHHIEERGTTFLGGPRFIFRDNCAPQLFGAIKKDINLIRLNKGFRFRNGYERTKILGYIKKISIHVLNSTHDMDREKRLILILNNGKTKKTYMDFDLSNEIFLESYYGGSYSSRKANILESLDRSEVSLDLTLYLINKGKLLKGRDLRWLKLSVELEVDPI